MSECSLSKSDGRTSTSCARRPTEPLGLRSIALGYGNQFALRARALCGCRTRRTERPIVTKPRLPIRGEAPNPSTTWGAPPGLGTSSHHLGRSAPPHVRHRRGATALPPGPPPPAPRPAPGGSQSEARLPTHRRLGEPPPGLGTSGSRGDASGLVHRASSARGDIHRLDAE